MPHQRSAEARARRHARAVRRGYVACRPDGHVHLLVPEALIEPVRTMALGMNAHVVFDFASAAPHYFLRHVAVVASHVVGLARANAALSLNRRCGVAKRLVSANLFKQPWGDAEEEEFCVGS